MCYSLCAGASSLLAASGEEGRRFCTPNTFFRLSQSGLEHPIQGQAEDISVEAAQILREKACLEEELAKKTGNSLEKISMHLRRILYLSAEEAVEYGLIDRVLTPHQEMGEKLNLGTRDHWGIAVVEPNIGFGESAV